MRASDTKKLLLWYREGHRPLPWRKTSDPYAIWISEVMLQQTTSTAVIPYYNQFLKEIPTVKSLANTAEAKVIELWAGLGYYSRAKNLLKAAKEIVAMGGFPKSHDELLKLPGFGPYTSRAVSSIAFGESVGVLDGNVIRILSRKSGERVEWWKSPGRKALQTIADQAVVGHKSGEVNQALMELGATICLPKNPKCMLCPWSGNCSAQKNGTLRELPLKKPKRTRELWLWEPQLDFRRGQLAFVTNEYAPFLKGQWLPPGKASRLKMAPTHFDFRHSITHHDIFVRLSHKHRIRNSRQQKSDVKWVSLKQLSQVNPTSLVKKVVQCLDKYN